MARAGITITVLALDLEEVPAPFVVREESVAPAEPPASPHPSHSARRRCGNRYGNGDLTAVERTGTRWDRLSFGPGVVTPH